MGGQKALSFLFKMSLFCSFLHSMHFYYLWNFRLGILQAFSILLFILLALLTKEELFRHSVKSLFVSLFFLLCLFFFNDGLDDTFKIIGAISFAIVVYILLGLKDSYRKEIFDFFYVGIFIILLPSLIVFILIGLGLNLPSGGFVVYPSADFYWYVNFWFVLIGTYGIRFNSLFCEPGHLGMILAFLIFIRGYNFKDFKTIILILSLILTLSLAGYILLALGYVFRSLQFNIKKTVKYCFLFLFAISISLIVVRNINGGNNVINDLIVDRLAFDEETGTIAGDNRVSGHTDLIFEEVPFYSFFFGLDDDSFDMLRGESIKGAGYKIFILKNGLLGVILTFLLYVFFASYSRNRLLAWLLLFLVSINFLQRAYPFWSSQIFIFITAMSVFTIEKLVIDNEKTHKHLMETE